MYSNMFQTRQQHLQHLRTFSRTLALWPFPEVVALSRIPQQSPSDLCSSWLLLSIPWLRNSTERNRSTSNQWHCSRIAGPPASGMLPRISHASSKQPLPRMCSIAHTLPAVSSLLSQYCSAGFFVISISAAKEPIHSSSPHHSTSA